MAAGILAEQFLIPILPRQKCWSYAGHVTGDKRMKVDVCQIAMRITIFKLPLDIL